MADESIVRDEVTRYGQHWLEVIRMGQPVDLAAWWDRVPLASLHLAKQMKYYEQKLDVHRVHLWWPAREPVRMVENGKNVVNAVLWFIEPGDTVRCAAYNAAAEYWLRFETWPSSLLLRVLPKGAPDRLCLPDEPNVQLSISISPLAPASYVLVR